jgi:hypothetical protein
VCEHGTNSYLQAAAITVHMSIYTNNTLMNFRRLHILETIIRSNDSFIQLVDNNQLDALNFSNIFICLSLSTFFGHYVPIIRRDPSALTQLLYLSFRFSCLPCEHYSAYKVHS